MDARQLDLDVALEIMGYRWVEWRHEALQGAPLDQPGRFLARADDPLSHLHTPAASGVPELRDALSKLPRYSGNLDLAMDVASQVGLFREGGAELKRGADGTWILDVTATERRYDGPEAPRLVCTAALEWNRGGSPGSSGS